MRARRAVTVDADHDLPVQSLQDLRDVERHRRLARATDDQVADADDRGVRLDRLLDPDPVHQLVDDPSAGVERGER